MMLDADGTRQERVDGTVMEDVNSLGLSQEDHRTRRKKENQGGVGNWLTKVHLENGH